MMQGWLDGCARLGLRIGFLERSLGLDYIEEHEEMFTGYKTAIEWKRVLCLVNVEP